MTEIQAGFEHLKQLDNYNEKIQLLSYFLNVFKNHELSKKSPSKDELEAIKNFIFDEMEILLNLIPKTQNYKDKDELFNYEDGLLGLFTIATNHNCEIKETHLEIVRALVYLVNEYKFFENTIDDVFKLEKITKADIVKILDIAKSITDEYHRGKLYLGVLYYKEKIINLSDESKDAMAEYFCMEFNRYIQKNEQLTEDEISNLEVAVDACQYFINESVLLLLKDILELKHNNIRYYAIATMLKNNVKIEERLITDLAIDLTYAYMTYYLLKRYNLTSLFPKEYSNPEYLAKSDMVHWLTYPTELGKVPDKIELLGNIKVKKELFYLFKYMSNSDTLSDDLKNEWLIGWSSEESGTFSNFDKLELFEKKNLKKTIKFIKKKLLN